MIRRMVGKDAPMVLVSERQSLLGVSVKNDPADARPNKNEPLHDLHHTSKKKDIKQTCLGIAEGGGRTRDLEVISL